jgi:hypothetical protein
VNEEGTALQTEQPKAHKTIYPPSKGWRDQLLAVLLVMLPYVLLNILSHRAQHYMPRALAYLIFAPIKLAYMGLTVFLAFTVFPYMTSRRLRPQLMAKVAAVYGESAPDAPMVGYSPGSEMRRFGLVTHQDFGLLILKPGMMTYLGDTVTFGLPRQQIEQVTIVEQSLFGTKVPRLLIGWREDPMQPLQGFTLEAWDASTLWQARAAVQALYQRVEQWRRAAVTGAPAPPIDRGIA